MTTLHMPNGNCVAALQPAPGDLFTITIVGGKVALVQSCDDYEKALRVAEACAERVAPPGGRPFTVKVLGMSLTELLAFQGISREEFAAALDISDAELRELTGRTCRDVLLRSNDAALRAEAMELLEYAGGLKS